MTTHPGENGEALHPGDPDRLGPYRLTGRLGRGGMGTVYLGEDTGGRRVAVKAINRELAGEAAFRERFRREVTAARQVRRFCTAPVLDAELDRDPLYVVTEYIDGPSLEKAVRERGPLQGSDLEALAVGVATALAAIHGAGIVHRDLKPANVLLSSTGPRVIDFGIARALDAADGPTRTGQFVGTPNYLPPEILRGEPVTPASDVFSWGCVVAYAGTGAAPFAGETVPAIFYRVVHEEPKLDALDPALRDVVAAALDKDPRNRPSVQELLGRLVGNGDTPDPATLAETVQAGWHAAEAGAGVRNAPTLQAPAVPGGGPAATARLGGDSTRDDASPSVPSLPPAPPARPPSPGPSGPSGRPGGGVPRRALAIGAAAVAVVALVAFVGYKVIGGGPPEKLAQAFADDFSSDASGWYTFGDDAAYRDNRYRLHTSGSTGALSAKVPKDDVKDFPERVLASVTVTATEGPPDAQYGLLCRSSEEGVKQYMFLIRVDGKGAVLRKANGDLGTKELATVDSVAGFDDEGPNEIQAACEVQDDDQKSVWLRLWVNGHEVFDETDSAQPLPNGKVGLQIMRGGNQAQDIGVEFDDFDMSKILD
ncbi:serine/threonine-protein kinase [Actinomadura algeriensis]|uniref:Serine/threonine protein kinase n=1 Tax=Actinomadura algeriensis TaxID=1679523 RepID=A0ABR9JIG7_9ACTN|nr:serine/threonine-protein kinase [Actinomadura algeriensis]MBE1530342.1 serine/threonine protein kinase [Actinomadura algeriensis]